MILVLGNFAGVFSNVCKFLNWSLVLKESDTLLFYYTNKGAQNNSIRTLPFQNYEEDTKHIFFYKYFEYPPNCSLETFFQRDTFEMGYPIIPKESLPLYLQHYQNGFILCSPSVYADPSFPFIRKLYHSHIEKRLQFTPSMKALIEPELQLLRAKQSEGKKILAVFLRFTGHFAGYNTEAVFQEIEEVIVNYDYILPITQVRPFLDRILQQFGDKCIRLPRNYLSEDIDWIHKNFSDKEFEEEVQTAIADVYLASQCDLVMGGSSNMFMGALLFNPNVSYKVFKELKEKAGG
jgi:hypothetical protein